ncbi:HAD family hydrolase [Eubacteriales bacterium OttesenSCG-928-A19]|nr:HAD family hydrolase [Eubacteriales bacterium OttesenSCG-928-A19]
MLSAIAVAFGDDTNDRETLEACGIGVAKWLLARDGQYPGEH